MSLKNLFSKSYIWILFVLVFIVIDQLSKIAVRKLHWSIFLNNQFAFSLPVPTLVMYLIYTIVLIGIFCYLFVTWRRFSIQQKIAWSLIIAGGLSNIIERLVYGRVVDFIYIANGILNLADIFIIFGLVILVLSTRKKDNQNFISN